MGRLNLRVVDYLQNPGGGERFVEAVLRHLPPDEVELTLVSNGAALDRYVALAARIARPIRFIDCQPAEHQSALRVNGECMVMGGGFFEVPPAILDQADVIWFPWVHRHLLPLTKLTRVVATFHDAIMVEFAEMMAAKDNIHGAARRIYLSAMERYSTGRLLSSQAKLVVDAKRTRDYLSKAYGPLAREPDVVYPSSEHIKAIAPEPIDHLSLPERFLLYPANIMPHKNHECLLMALAKVKAESPDHFLPLALSGNATDSISAPADYRSAYVRALVDHLGLEIGKDLLLLGTLSDGQFRAVLDRTTALVFPTMGEGYGFPPVEAGLLGVPVASSNIDIMRENLDRLRIPALWFRPDAVDQLAEILVSLSRDEARLRAAAQAAVPGIADDSWDEVGRRYAALFRQQAEFADFHQRYVG